MEITIEHRGYVHTCPCGMPRFGLGFLGISFHPAAADNAKKKKNVQTKRGLLEQVLQRYSALDIKFSISISIHFLEEVTSD